MKKQTLLTLITVLVWSGMALAAQPYSTKKAPKLLKAQSPIVVVKDLPQGTVVKAEKIAVEPVVTPQQKQVSAQPSPSKVKDAPVQKDIAVASSSYVPTAKQLRKMKRAEKKLKKNADAIGESKSLVAALLLCFFVGIFGIHRFYMGYYGIGILQLLTLGFFGIWTLIDLILLIVGELQPKNGTFEQSLDEELDTIF